MDLNAKDINHSPTTSSPAQANSRAWSASSFPEKGWGWAGRRAARPSLAGDSTPLSLQCHQVSAIAVVSPLSWPCLQEKQSAQSFAGLTSQHHSTWLWYVVVNIRSFLLFYVLNSLICFPPILNLLLRTLESRWLHPPPLPDPSQPAPPGSGVCHGLL